MITEVGPEGQIIKPEKYRSRFRNALGYLVRDNLNPAIPNWNSVPELKKKELWDTKVAINFRFLEGKSELVKSHAFKIMGHAF